MTTVDEIISKIEEFAPRHLAEDWDPIGLSIGNRKQSVQRMMVALDLDADTLKEAQEKKVDFIFTHHPAIFSPLKTLNEDDYRRKEYIALIRSKISLYSAHTNIDAAENGMNDWLAEAIDLEQPYDLMDFSYEHSFKLVTLYGTKAELAQTLQILDKMTAGELKEHNPILCGLTSENTAKSGESLNEDEKVELIVPDYLVSIVIEQLYQINTEKTPVFHLTAIEKQGKSYGIGRVGELKDAVSIEKLIEQVKKAFSVPNVRTSAIDLDKKVQRIAILGGSGEKYYKQALAQKADLYITGDISYHGAQDMIREGLAFIDPGHFIENIFVEKMTELLTEWKEEENWQIEIIPSTTQKDVFVFK